MYDLNSVILKHDDLVFTLDLMLSDYSIDADAIADVQHEIEQLENIIEMLRAARS
tara:strand:- start:2198 stop:2362 length:165 start_codon:yes stop_codon:yes gene_type:complete